MSSLTCGCDPDIGYFAAECWTHHVMERGHKWEAGLTAPQTQNGGVDLFNGLKEVRVTDPETGGQKGQKLAQLGALDPLALMEVAEVAGFGGQKYERYNFAKGYKWSLSYDALQRHLHLFWAGENRDKESGLFHLAHAAWHCLALLTFYLRGKGTDDRFPRG